MSLGYITTPISMNSKRKEINDKVIEISTNTEPERETENTKVYFAKILLSVFIISNIFVIGVIIVFSMQHRLVK